MRCPGFLDDCNFETLPRKLPTSSTAGIQSHPMFVIVQFGAGLPDGFFSDQKY
jgi:hypothetical protein